MMAPVVSVTVPRIVPRSVPWLCKPAAVQSNTNIMNTGTYRDLDMEDLPQKRCKRSITIRKQTQAKRRSKKLRGKDTKALAFGGIGRGAFPNSRMCCATKALRLLRRDSSHREPGKMM